MLALMMLSRFRRGRLSRPLQEESSVVAALVRIRLSDTPWTLAHQAPLSMEFSRQEYLSGLPFPSPGDLLDPGMEPGSPALQADSLLSEPPGKQEERFGQKR